MSEAIAIQHEPELPSLVVVTAIQRGATPRAVELAFTERGHTDTLLVLARETGVDLLLIHSLADRWGIHDAI
ncbi:hypothetical protein [Thioalkalivibrio sp.]|uniref:hypothetical protein n=1 Tax=Thioalkalivibrio sp. TaxID=2093813 RepID=UPI00356A3C71